MEFAIIGLFINHSEGFIYSWYLQGPGTDVHTGLFIMSKNWKKVGGEISVFQFTFTTLSEVFLLADV